MTDELLTFELTDSEKELEIHFNRQGLRNLLKILHRLADSDSPLPRHDHLMTPSWAGNELTEIKQRETNRLLNKVSLRLWP